MSGHAILASWPTRSFKNQNFNEKDAVLVQGKALKGASGSPIITFARGLKMNTDSGSAETDDYCPQKLIGVVSGHFFKDEGLFSDPDKKREDFFNHSDYSYFIRSTSILYLLRKNNCHIRKYSKYQSPYTDA